MRFLVRQKILALTDKFTIKDESGRDWFTVRSKMLSLFRKLWMDDMQGREIAFIEQKFALLLPEYRIYLQGQEAACIKQVFSFFKPRFNITGTAGQFELQGNLLMKEFTLLHDGIPCATISKSWFSFTDSYGVEVHEGQDPILTLAIVIALDQIKFNGNQR